MARSLTNDQLCELRQGNASFGSAISALKEGYIVTRENWDKGKFVFMQVPSTINKEIVPKMQSLPESVKNELGKRFSDSNEQIDAIYYNNQLALVDKSNLIVGYTASTTDILAEDWTTIEGSVKEE